MSSPLLAFQRVAPINVAPPRPRLFCAYGVRPYAFRPPPSATRGAGEPVTSEEAKLDGSGYNITVRKTFIEAPREG